METQTPITKIQPVTRTFKQLHDVEVRTYLQLCKTTFDESAPMRELRALIQQSQDDVDNNTLFLVYYNDEGQLTKVQKVTVNLEGTEPTVATETSHDPTASIDTHNDPTASTEKSMQQVLTMLAKLTAQMSNVQNNLAKESETLQRQFQSITDATMGPIRSKVEPHMPPAMISQSTLYDPSTSHTPASVYPQPVIQQAQEPAPTGQHVTDARFPFHTVLQKLDTYDNSEPQKLHQWLRQMQVITDPADLTDKQKYKVLGLCFKGKALDILYELQQTHQIKDTMDFAEVKTKLLLKLVPVGIHQKNLTDFHARIMSPHETVSNRNKKRNTRKERNTKQFKTNLEEIATSAFQGKSLLDIQERVKEKFCSGALPKMREYLLMTSPVTLDECMQRAREYEGIRQPTQVKAKAGNPFVGYQYDTKSSNRGPNNGRSGGNKRFNQQSRPLNKYCSFCKMNNHWTSECFKKPDNWNPPTQRHNPGNVPNNRSSNQSSSFQRKPTGNRAFFTNTNQPENAHVDGRYNAIFESEKQDYDNSVSFAGAIGGASQRSRVEIVVNVENQPSSVMVDTGASISLCDRQHFDSLQTKLKIHPANRSVFSLSNTALKIQGKVPLMLTVGNKTFYHAFCLVENCPVKLILGSDFLDKTQAVVNYGKLTVTLQDKVVPMIAKQTEPQQSVVLGAITVPPRTAKLVKALVRGFPDGKPLLMQHQCFSCKDPNCFHNAKQINPDNIKQMSQKEVHSYSETCLVQPKQGEIVFQVYNPTSADLQISEKTIHVEPIQPEDIVEVKAPKTETKSLPKMKPQVTLRELIQGLKIQETTKSLKTQQRNRLVHVLAEYLDVFVHDDSQLTKTDIAKHKIDTGYAKPIAQPLRRVPFKQREFLKKHLRQMLARGFIVAIYSPWASPIVLVPKKDGTIRFCVDYRLLNAITRSDQYPLPHTDDLLETIGRSIIFSKLDLCSGFWQIAMDLDDIPKTAFRTLFGHFEFLVMPFGLKNAPATFQRMIENVLRDLLFKSAVVLIDDILIFSSDIDTHIDVDVPSVLQKLRQHNLKAKVKKCKFATKEIEFLGHTVSETQIRPLQSKVNSISKMPAPNTVKELRRFLGMVNYYRKFIKDMAKITKPLNNLLRKDVPYEFTPDCTAAFDKLKKLLTSKPVMTTPDFNKPFVLTTDASYQGLGAILSQRYGKYERVIAYASRTLNDAENNYGITELEALAVVWAIRYFRNYLVTSNFTVITDHQPLRWLWSTKDANPRLSRWALELQGYDFTVEYKKGELNTNADCLSRCPIDSPQENAHATQEIPTLSQLKREQRKDPVLNQIIQCIDNNVLPQDSKLQSHLKMDINNYFLDNSLLRHVFHQINHARRRTVRSQVVIPKVYTQTVMHAYHDDSIGGHLGFAKTYLKIRERYHWIRMYMDIKEYCQRCIICNQRKSPPMQPRAPLQPLPPAEYPFQRVACNFIEFPKSTSGNKYVLVFTDYLTRYVEAIATPDWTAATTARYLVDNIIARHAALRELLSNRGPNFTSELIKQVCSVFKVKKTFTTSYHPATDGLTERFNKTMAEMLSAYTAKNQRDWDKYLSFIVMAYNSSVQESTLQTPFFLLYGRDPILPIDVLLGREIVDAPSMSEYLTSLREVWKIAKENTVQAQRKQKRLYDRRATQRDYNVGDKVYLDDPVTPPGQMRKLRRAYAGPFRVIQKTSPNTVRLENLDGSKPTFHDNVNVDRIKPAYG